MEKMRHSWATTLGSDVGVAALFPLAKPLWGACSRG